MYGPVYLRILRELAKCKPDDMFVTFTPNEVAAINRRMRQWPTDLRRRYPFRFAADTKRADGSFCMNDAWETRQLLRVECELDPLAFAHWVEREAA